MSPSACSLRARSRTAPWPKAAAVAACLLSAACSSGPAPTTYDLSAASGRVRGTLPGQVMVAEPAAVQALSTQQIIVKDASGTISFLGSGQWADSLPRLVQARLIHTFENASQIRAVTRPSSGAAADLQLVTEIRSFEVQTPASEAVVQISVKIVADGTGRILAGRIFTGRAPVAAVDAAHAARSLDAALSAVMLDVVRWVASARTPAATVEAAG